MNNVLEDINIIELVQSCLQDNIEIQAIAAWLDDELSRIYKAGEKVKLTTRLNDYDLEDWEVDELLIQESVDYYVDDLTKDQKITLIQASTKSHKRKGTPYALETNLKTIFEDAEILEWFNYEGDPYKFQVVTPSSMTSDELTKIYKVIEANKNTRSTLEGVMTSSQWEGANYFGTIINTAIFEEIQIADGVAEDFENYIGG
ncbi:phage tail protein [Ilyobacter polytropus]|uniref:Phage tail protein I n=1 Tax=Ilyobacter polytropus (strain ATCC 51220 / DSM 2926 / LMG 16218 / CuHBu1) TaxID=572544 RepID=E3HBK5_ILYPC|nr:phage tail protein [Ilyobacter polytropus]ADO83701.1 hypothetical protein Ilyop_1930 [Ilyobacter polytropus DSM 2926]